MGSVRFVRPHTIAASVPASIILYMTVVGVVMLGAEHAGRRFTSVGAVVRVVTKALTMGTPLDVYTVVDSYGRHVEEDSPLC